MCSVGTVYADPFGIKASAGGGRHRWRLTVGLFSGIDSRLCDHHKPAGTTLPGAAVVTE